MHIYADQRPKAGPLHIPPLHDLRGEHIATVRWDTLSCLPPMRAKTRVTGPEVDWAFGVPEGVEAGALLLYANGAQPAFMARPIQVVFHVERAGKPPVFFGLLAAEKEPLADEDGEGGVTVLAGFDARKDGSEASDYLYLRGV